MSVQTVSLALRHHPSISAATRERIHALAIRLGYRPDPVLQALVAYRSKQAVPIFHGSLAYISAWRDDAEWQHLGTYRQYYESARERASELGYQLELYSLPQVGSRRPGFYARADDEPRLGHRWSAAFQFRQSQWPGRKIWAMSSSTDRWNGRR